MVSVRRARREPPRRGVDTVDGASRRDDARRVAWILLPALVPLVAVPWRVGNSLAIALVTVVVVACVAAAHGRMVGLFAGLAGATAFDLLVVHPYGTLAVSRRDDLLAIAAMSVVGLLVGHLSQEARTERELRDGSERELLELRSLLELAAAGESPGRLVVVAEAAVRMATGFPCRYEPVPILDNLPELHHASLHVPSGDRGPLATPELLQVPVRADGVLLGRLVLEMGRPVPVGALAQGWRARVTAIADQLGQALAVTAE
jgi:hypothetical protein